MSIQLVPTIDFTFKDISRDFGYEMGLAIQQRFYKIAQNAARYAKSKAPVLSGALRASIYATGSSADLSRYKDIDKKLAQPFVRSVGRAVAAHQLHVRNYNVFRFTNGWNNIDQFKKKASKLEYPEELISSNPKDRQDVEIYTQEGMTEDDKGFTEFTIPTSDHFFVSIGTNIYYARWVEEGHNIVNKNGTIVGHVEAQPFMRPAFIRMQNEIQNVANELGVGGLF